MLDAYTSFLFTAEKEVPVRAISHSSDQCQLGGRTNMGKVKLLFLPISMQLFLTVYSNLLTWFWNSYKSILAHRWLSNLFFFEETRARTSYSTIFLTLPLNQLFLNNLLRSPTHNLFKTQFPQLHHMARLQQKLRSKIFMLSSNSSN